MKLVFYSHDSKLGNGGTESLLAIVSGFAQKHDCVVITPTINTLNNELTKKGIHNVSLPFKWTSNFNNELNYLGLKKSGRIIKSWIKTLRFHKKNLNQHIQYIKEFKPDVIYSNTSVISMGLMVAQHLNIPHIWHLREFQNSKLKLMPNFGFWYFSNQLKKSDVLIANSKAMQSFYKKHVPKKKIDLVYNGIEPNPNFTILKEQTPFVFLMVGALMKVKGQEEAIAAAKILADRDYNFRIDIVGKGKSSNELKDLISRLGLEGIVFLHGQQSNVEKYYNRANCYLMCSESESFGRVTVEAMLHGIPVIGKVGVYTATGEIIRDKIDGLHYTDPNELAKNMECMLLNPQKGIAMGQAGKIRAKQYFSLSASIEKIETILIETLSSNKDKKANLSILDYIYIIHKSL
jgi:glycosyltransferase involved in cell wall biosynthesis